MSSVALTVQQPRNRKRKHQQSRPNKQVVLVASGAKRAQPKRARKRRRGNNRSLVRADANPNFRYLKCLMDPFANEPVYPGFEGIHGDLFTVRTRFGPTLNADGSGYFVITPCLTGQIVQNTAAAAVIPVYTYVNSVGTATVTSSYFKARPVACGVRVYCVQSASTDQGQMTYGLLPGGAINTDTPNVAFSTNNVFSSEHCKLGNFRDGCQVIWLPEDAYDYTYSGGVITGSAVTAGAPNISAPQIVVSILSANASARIAIEVVFHFEAHFGISTGLESGMDSGKRLNTTTKDPMSLIDSMLGTAANGFKLVSKLAGPLGTSNFLDAISAAAEWYSTTAEDKPYRTQRNSFLELNQVD